MSFDINETLKSMIDAAKSVMKEEWPKAKDAFDKVIRNEQETLRKVADARLNNEIDDDGMKHQLDNAKASLKTGLLMVEVVNKVMIQNAINAAVKAFWSAVEKALKSI